MLLHLIFVWCAVYNLVTGTLLKVFDTVTDLHSSDSARDTKFPIAFLF